MVKNVKKMKQYVTMLISSSQVSLILGEYFSYDFCNGVTFLTTELAKSGGRRNGL